MPSVIGWMEEGIETGLEQGRQRMANLILRQLRRRFGEIEPDRENLIRQLSLSQLEKLGEDAIGFSSLAQIDSYLVN